MNDAKNHTNEAKKRKHGGFAKLLTIAYRNIYRNKRRSVLCILAISITVFFIIAMAAFMEGMLDNFRKQTITYETGHVFVASKEYEKKSAYMPLQYPVEIQDKDISEVIRELETIPGVEKVFPRIKTRATVLDSVVKSAILWGIDMEKELPYNVFNYKTKNAHECLLEGRYPQEYAKEAAIGFRLAKKMGLAIGDQIALQIQSSEFSSKYYYPVITGIVDFNLGEMDKNAVIIPFARAQKLATLEGKTQALYVYAENAEDASVIAAAAKAKLAAYGDLSIKSYTSHPYLVLMEMSNIMMGIIYIVFLIVASFLIINTIIMVIHERIKEIGMMGALGMTRREIVAVFFLESLVLSGIGSVIGCVVGAVTTFIVSQVPFDFGTMYEDMFVMNNTIFVMFSPQIILQGFLYGLIVSGACTIFPSLKSAFIKPVEAIRR